MKRIKWLILLSGIGIIMLAAGFFYKDYENDAGDHVAEDTITIEDYSPVIQDYDSSGEEVKVIPDPYNTGCDLSQEMYLPDTYAASGEIQSRENDYVMNLGKDVFSQEKITFENLYVLDKQVFLANSNAEYPNGTIEFVNCYFGQGIKIPSDCQKKLIFSNCDFLAKPVSAVNAEFNSCKFYKSIGDGLQIHYNVKLEDCYIYDNGYGNADEYHADGIQIAGFGSVAAHDIYIDNTRIEMPRCAPEYGQNAALFIKMDYARGYDMTFQNMIVNGGTYTVYIMPHNYQLNNLSFENIKAGYTHLWKNWLNGFDSEEADYGWNGSTNDNCGYQNQVYVSSIIKKEEGEVSLCITNETDSSRQIRIETDKGESFIDVPAVLKYDEIEAADAVFDECNIDMLFEVMAYQYVKVYDGDQLIRYKEL